MDGSPNPFAAFAFHGGPLPKRQRIIGAPLVANEPAPPPPLPSATVREQLHKKPAPSAAQGSAATTTGGSTSCPVSVEQRLAEYRLIASYRDASRASVDDFHRFLIDLGTGGEPELGEPRHGRFWALVACLLSVQCRDGVALIATRKLLRRCAGQGAAGVVALSDDELDECVHSCNFCNTKAKNVRAAAEHAERRGGKVPTSYDDLLAIPGVGPKIAHLMRSVAYGAADAGIVVDTHVFRVATRLGWVDATAALSGAEAVRVQLERWVPLADRVAFSLAVVGFGQHARSGKGWGDAFVEHARCGPGNVEGEDDAARRAESVVARLDGTKVTAVDVVVD